MRVAQRDCAAFARVSFRREAVEIAMVQDVQALWAVLH